jgi:hypothetical protein
MTGTKTKSINIDQIRTDGGTQPRETIDRCVVDDYSRAIADLPPVVVYYDGSDYWLADGFHRLEAHILTNAAFIDCEVRQGTVRDAILYSVSANANHGIRRTNADKRRSVLRLLNDGEWGKWSDRKIADQCGVSNSFVGDVRQESSVALQQMRMVDRGGKTFVAETAAKGDRKPRTLAAGKVPAATFGDIDTDDEPTANYENERPEPDADEIERKASNKRYANGAPMEALAACEASKPMAARDAANAAIKLLERIPRSDPDRAAAIECVSRWIDSYRGKGQL